MELGLLIESFLSVTKAFIGCGVQFSLSVFYFMEYEAF